MTVSLGPDNNPGNARWCMDHGRGRLECTKRKRDGELCHGRAIAGIDACSKHSGVSRVTAKMKGKATISVWSAMGQSAPGEAVDTGVAVMNMLQTSWLRAAFYGEMLRRQVALAEPLSSDPGEVEVPSPSGIVGFRYSAASDGTVYVQNEEIRALVALEAAERDRVVRYAKTAHDMGISERWTSMVEQWGDVVIGRIMLLLEQLHLSPEQEKLVPALMQVHLAQIEIGMGGQP